MAKVSVTKNMKDALQKITSEDCEMNLEQKFDFLTQEIIAFGMHLIFKKMSGNEVDEEAISWQEFAISQQMAMTRVLMNAKKVGRFNPPSNPEFEKNIMQAIKNKKSSVANIVTNVPSFNNNGHEQL